MRKLLGMILLLCAFGVQAHAQEESEMTLTNDMSSQIKINIDQDVEETRNPTLRFQIGKSEADLGKTLTESRGSGLTVSVAYDFNNLFAAGGSYTNLKIDQTVNNFDVGTYQNSYASDVFMGYAEVTPIRYSVRKVDFAGSFLVGVMNNPSNEYRNESAGFYGGALTLSLNKQIGISLDTKVSRDLRAMNQLSLVGYY